MKELRLKKLTRARMEQWLRENPNAKFDTCSVRSCPVAHFIMKTYPSATLYTVGAAVGNIETKVSKREVRKFHLPVWARKFIRRVDNTPNVSCRITGKQALEILTNI